MCSRCQQSSRYVLCVLCSLSCYFFGRFCNIHMFIVLIILYSNFDIMFFYWKFSFARFTKCNLFLSFNDDLLDENPLSKPSKWNRNAFITWTSMYQVFIFEYNTYLWYRLCRCYWAGMGNLCPIKCQLNIFNTSRGPKNI